MGHFSGSSLEVQVLWGSRHVWAAGREYDGPCYAHALWLMLEGEAHVGDGEREWCVSPGHVFGWPRDVPRRVYTPHGATWLSLGLQVTAPGGADLLRLLPLPALHPLQGADSGYMHSWMSAIVGIREALAREAPEDAAAARYKYLEDAPAGSPAYDEWIGQVLSGRPPHLDVVEEGLARALFGWCWGLWGPMSLDRALHHQSPRWLQRTLDLIHAQPGVGVHELASRSGFSPAQFRRCFHQEVGQAPLKYLQAHRLETARRLLESTNLPVSEVAARAGFGSVPHFIQLWKRANGVAPLQYRLAHERKTMLFERTSSRAPLKHLSKKP